MGNGDRSGEASQGQASTREKCVPALYAPVRRVLAIAGTDSSGGAGIAADLKTIMANGAYGMCAITAVTAQNTVGVRSIQAITPQEIADQIAMVFEDIRPDAVKVGMVCNAEQIKAIARALSCWQAANVVVDPVMVASTGVRLQREDALDALLGELLPISTLITPNVGEAFALVGRSVPDSGVGHAELEAVATELYGRCGCAVLCKGGHLSGSADDLLVDASGAQWFGGARINNPNTHGTGCTLSSAIAANLAKGFSLSQAVARGKEYVRGAIGAQLDLGQGSGPMDHAFCLRGDFMRQ